MRFDDEEEKNSLLKDIICFALILNFIFFIWGFFFMNSFMHDYTPIGPPPPTLLVGTGESPKVLDPLKVGPKDSTSNDVISQVAETLFWYDLTNDSLPLEPLLADTYSWDVTNTELTINIKQGVYFHDGTILDAAAVKWNMDRILYFTNATGDLPPTTITAYSTSIYFHNGVSIMNRTEVVDADTVIIYLNKAFASFMSLLSYTASSIISPATHSNTEYIDLTTERLVGTGPYIYYSYMINVGVGFHRWNRYHGDAPYFEKLEFVVLDDTATLNQAMLGHMIDILFGADPDLLDNFIADPEIDVVENGPDLNYWYMAFDTYRINITWREAISKAYNYSHIIEEIRGGDAVRGPPCVPSGMPGHNSSVTVAQYNVPEARMIMQSMGFGVGWDVGSQNGDIFTPGAHETNWSDSTFFTDAFGYALDVNHLIGSGLNSDLNEQLFSDLDKIGIGTVETLRSMKEFLFDGENGLLKGVWFGVWSPNYIDAFNILDPLFNPDSPSNFCNLTDPQILAWLAAAAVETNITNRYEIFGNLQYRLFEVLYAHMPLFASLGRTIHGIDIQGYPYNQLGIFLAWPIYRGTA
jgi:ABC-type transport system substrate-binding protein